ncbi:MAG TPA: RNA polymerase sigma-70 factor [Steroidobacteraceae bacterium]|nr:RNA polymerase sigma-70 factor [Steroidobacteraceae bacterium]
MQESTEFERHRPRLFGIAYRMLGSRSDAEDILQDAYLRWHRGASQELRSPEAWLVTTVTRLCIDRLRAARTQREQYIGPWLPEPLIGDTAPAADARAELSSSLSIAFLVVLEQLEPDERAAFLLHEVFDTDYAEIAEILGKSEAACRQIVSRARKRVRGRRPRTEVTDAARRSVLERFANAIQTQDKAALLELVADQASWTSDGGGRTRAALKAIRGRDHVVRFALGVLGRHADKFAFEMTSVNGEPALAVRAEGKLFSVITVRTDGVRILDVYTVLNPDKLGAAPAPRRAGR